MEPFDNTWEVVDAWQELTWLDEGLLLEELDSAAAAAAAVDHWE